MYKAYVATIRTIRKHQNADRLQIVTVFGSNTIVDMSYHEGQRIVYFPVGGQVSEEFATKNNLVKAKDENGNNVGGFLDPKKRNITAIKLRGEKSDGLVLPIECLSYCADVSKFKNGDAIDVVNGHEICKKYIPASNKQKISKQSSNKPKEYGEKFAPLFEQHIETEQLAYNLSDFHVGDQIEITLKMHGTSQRTGYLPILEGRKETVKETLCNRAAKLLNKFGLHLKDNRGTPVYGWGYVSGTRRTVLGKCEHDFYGNDNFRTPHAKFFEGKLHKGETVYYEVVGFMDNGRPIMPSADNKKTGDKEFVKKYGKTTFFSYGCDSEGKTGLKSDFYVYRMTMTNEDGNVVEYTPEFMRYRCEQMGAKCVLNSSNASSQRICFGRMRLLGRLFSGWQNNTMTAQTQLG